MRVVVSKNFSQQVGHSFVDFYAGGVITDEVLAGVLLKSGAPVEEVSDDNMMQCPHCRRAFSVKVAVAREALPSMQKASTNEPSEEEDED